MLEPFHQYIKSKVALTTDDLKTIDAVCVVKKLRKNQYLLQQGDVWQFNAFVSKGCMRVYRIDENGKEHILQFCPENYWTGDRESLLSGTPARSNIDAIEDSEVVLIRKDDFDNLRIQLEPFNRMVNTILERSFSASQNRIHVSISYTAEEKYLNFITTYPDLANRIPQSMIASYLGISPETLSRVRNKVSRK
ncbi:MAG TPA: Crp/Fnr family transcriptional regulator [Chryseosolibacter sp.]